MKKRIYVVLLVACMALMTACGSKNVDAVTDSGTATENVADVQTDDGEAGNAEVADGEAVIDEVPAAPEITDGNYPVEEAYMKILGRSKYFNNIRWFSLSATGIEFNFKDASTITVTLNGDSSVRPNQENHRTRYGIFINDEEKIVDLLDEETKDVTVDVASVGTGVFRLSKLSESADSTFGVSNVYCDGVVTPTAKKELNMQFIGDSITCGYGVDGSDTDVYKTENENALKSYAYKTATKLDADYTYVSYSGYGVLSGYTGNGSINDQSLLPLYYERIGHSYGDVNGLKMSDQPWDFSNDDFDIVVINLGTNDASYAKDDEKKSAFVDAYVDFLGMVRGYNPNATIVCVLGVMGQDLCSQVDEAVLAFGDSNVYSLKLPVQDVNKNGKAVDWHPSEASHEDAANTLVEFLQSQGLV